ncbi:MAG: hypothetical protein A2293_03100 [Elusimicrobia bacterium RIFOXYB2_FULL_49_7]|nr:MAG: hypothetical protein A2293_03100 [Elusimicrobia bacterium RIFOXYB2_FULL_49_7]
MKTVVITTWNGVVSPLFEAAGTLLFIRQDGLRETVTVSGKTLLNKVDLLNIAGECVLICGAISRLSLMLLLRKGIAVFPWVRGPVEEVFTAFRNRSLSSSDCYSLPGCSGSGQRKRFGWHEGNRFCCRKLNQPGGKK